MNDINYLLGQKISKAKQKLIDEIQKKEFKMRRFKFYSMFSLLIVLFLPMWLSTSQEPQEIQKLTKSAIFFSTEEEFVTRASIPKDGNEIISDGDLLSSNGYVFMRNYELLGKFGVKRDLGLDAADVIDIEEHLIIFSTELDHPEGVFTAGDLLATNGAILPNSALLAAFDISRSIDLGLDAVYFVGKSESVRDFLLMIEERKLGREDWIRNPESLIRSLKRYNIDIWFSTEGTAPPLKEPKFLDGDLLSAATGSIVLSNHDALPVHVPAGIKERGVDFGLDAVAMLTDPTEKIEKLLFSTEINGRLPSFTDGDALIKGNGVIFYNGALINAFEPKVKDLGLDALSMRLQPQKLCRFIRVGGVDVNPTTWDFNTGYVDYDLSGRKDHVFGSWVSIRGVLSPDTVEHRVLYRPEGGADSPILMPAALGWRVCCHWLGLWIPVVIDGDGWMSTNFWRFLKDPCLNPDLILVNWRTSKATTPDGKYILTLQIKDGGGNIKTCDALAIQVDNTKPMLTLSDEHECKEYRPANMPLIINGAIFDNHFFNYNLHIAAFGLPYTLFASGRYFDGPPLFEKGTTGYPTLVKLGELDIPSLLGDRARGGRYTVILSAWDRSLRGHFNPYVNIVMDIIGRNWDRRITNFEFYL